MNFKRIGTYVTAAAVITSLMAGCSQTPTETEPQITVTETTAAVTESTEPSAEVTEPDEPLTFEDLYGNQLPNYLDHQYYFDGQPVSVQESNYFFIDSFLSLSNYANAGSYPATLLGYIDLAAEYPGDDFATYGDCLVNNAEASIENTCIICQRAAEEGITLSDDRYAMIDSVFDDYRASAADSGMSLDEYLKFYLGPSTDEASYRKVLERYMLVDAYTEHYCESYGARIPLIKYAYFAVAETDEQALKDAAMDAANKMKDACGGDMANLDALAAAGMSDGTVLDYGELQVQEGILPQGIEDWAMSGERAEGDLEVIYEPELGYFVIGYNGTVADSEKAMEALLISLDEEKKAGTHDFHTDDVYLPSPEGPTATPVSDTPVPTEIAVSNPDSATGSAPAGSVLSSDASSTDVLIVVFYTLAGVAVAAVIIILIAYAVRKNRQKSAAAEETEEEDESEDNSGEISGDSSGDIFDDGSEENSEDN